MLRPYDYHVYTRLDPLPTSPKIQRRILGEGQQVPDLPHFVGAKMGEGEGRGDWRLEGYTSINGRSPFYSEGEASDGKILNFQYHFWRMLRPYDILVDTLAGPPS